MPAGRWRACVAAALLAGCGALPNGAPSAAPRSSAVAVYNHAFLYVGNDNGSHGPQLVVYRLHDSKPSRKLFESWGVYAIAIDPWGDVYTTSNFPSGGTIDACTAGCRRGLFTIYEDAVNALAFDSKGDLYAVGPVGVGVYAPRSTKFLRGFYKGLHNPDAAAFDSAGNVYVASLSNDSSGVGPGSIAVFATGQDKPFRRITTGVRTPVALTFDPSGDLYVANCPGCFARHPLRRSGFVSEYAAGSATPSRTLEKGVDSPVALAMGENGLIFVANNPFQKTGWVTVYSSSGSAPMRKITRHASGNSLAVDADKFLYIENRSPCCSVSVYSPDGSRLVRSITNSVFAPQAIAIGHD